MISIAGLLSTQAACGGGGGGGSDSPGTPQNNLTSTNLAPTISAPAALSVLEGLNLSTQIATSDPNMDEVTLSLGQNSADSSLFSLDNTGQIRFRSLPDFENPADADNDNEYQLTVIASDGTLTTNHDIAVTVADAFEGRVVDGPLAGAIFFVDLNGNETQDQGEPFGTTDASGFILIPQFTITEGQTPRLISRGGTDTTTGIELPNLTLIALLDLDTASFKSITPLTTLLSAATNSSGHTDILRALGVTVSVHDALSLDAWSESQAGSAEAQALQRINLQIGVLLNSAQTLLSDPTSTASENLSVTQSLSAEILRQAQTGSAVALTDANTLASIIVSAADSNSQTDAGQNGLLIGNSIASINSVIANATLNPTSETAQDLVGTTQNQLAEAISAVNSGAISPEEFATNTSPENLFSEISTPQNTPDTDNDGLENSLDPDDDNDGVLDVSDTFPLDAAESADTDLDGIGNNADTDDDNDGILDTADAFPVNTSETTDTDSDGIGNNADTDDDNDGTLDAADAFPLNAAESADTDLDGIGNNADTDDDNDGVLDVSDTFPLDITESADSDSDGTGNNADTDDDNDGVLDADDDFPLNNAESMDTDSDGIGNNADTDDDNDGVLDAGDAFPLDAAESADTDLNGTGNNADTDDDNDGVLDVSDAFPLNNAESIDTDSDGIGNNADTDDDNDGVLDINDAQPLNPDIHTLPVALSQSLSLNLASGTLTSISGNLTSTSQDSRSVTYSIVTPASLGTITLSNTSTGAYTYQTSVSTTEAATDSFTFRVNDGFINSLDTTVPIAINSDPLYPFQWHLNNTGQTTFSDSGGITGEDLNVDSVTNAGTTGSGVIVAVVDEGMEIAHPDLVANVVVNGSYDYVENDPDPTNPSTTGDHGTSVGGIIAATGWNNIGVRGVAPGASLKGFNFLRNQSLSNEIDALGGNSTAPSGDVDVFNLSFGINTTTAFRINTLLEAQLKEGTTNLRGGRGAIYIKSAGNGFSRFTSAGRTITCSNAAILGVSCQNTAQDPMHVLPYIIGAAALNASGTASSYSTAGATNWISAPGGEFGQNQSFLISQPGQPAIMTTDQSSCSRGYTRAGLTNPRNAFEDRGTHSLNTQCSYTSIFNGTSSAAPNVSGVVALMLAANSALTWRDVKHILATTARQVDASRTNVTANGIDVEPAWTTNAAGLTFHNVYGFGAIDARAAVAAAQTYVADSLGTFKEGTIRSNSTDIMVPDLTGATSVINEPDVGTVEFVRVEIFANHSFPSDWTIALTSPSGTRSVLLPAFNAYQTWPSGGFELGSNAFYGEPQQGNWTLELFDHLNPDAGTLTS